ncbi:hypothetical protein D0Y65_026775, partial [Glycine soja]
MLCPCCSAVFEKLATKAFEASKIRKSSKKEYYEYQNPPWVNRNMSKTQWRRHQRMKRDAILGMQKNNGVRPLVLNRIIEGLPPGFEKKKLRKEQEDKEVIIDCFEYSFEDSLEAICGVISILPADYAKDYQNEHMLRDFSYFTSHRNAADFDPPTSDMSCHIKPLHLTTMVEDHIINKILVDGGATFNILPRSILQRFGRNVEDLIPHNIVVSNLCRKPL